jgi:nitroimidazol reductase NimA-like FMN-containing flavoprotein (pyridoxamine 5'-phosphate oxidase superfamily)
VPVTYVVEDGTIVFRTAPGTKVEGLLTGPASFQVDDVDALRHTGWSVLVDGRAAVSWADGAEREEGRWVSWHLPLVVTLTPSSVSGRELVLAHPDTDRRGYR